MDQWETINRAATNRYWDSSSYNISCKVVISKRPVLWKQKKRYYHPQLKTGSIYSWNWCKKSSYCISRKVQYWVVILQTYWQHSGCLGQIKENEGWKLNCQLEMLSIWREILKLGFISLVCIRMCDITGKTFPFSWLLVERLAYLFGTKTMLYCTYELYLRLQLGL